jgi:DNA-directed RNA polymerase specialized sigma24 family protein
MSGMQNRFQEKVEHFARVQHEVNKYVQDFERRASEQPFVCADEAWANTLGHLRFLRQRSIELYGLDVGHYGPIILNEVLVPAEKEPSSWENTTPFYGSIEAITFAVFLVTEFNGCNISFAGMKCAYRRPDIWGIHLADAVCECYAEMLRSKPRSWFVAIETVRQRFPGVARPEALAEALTGYFITQLSPNNNPRLRSALWAEKTMEENLHQALLRELPAESLDAWAERGHRDLKELRNHIAWRLESLGRESSFKDRLAETRVEMPETKDEENVLEEFVHRETLRQELDQLRVWAEKTKLSEQQRRVYELDMRLDFDTRTIAQELGIKEGHVRQVRKNYQDKIRETRRAAGR